MGITLYVEHRGKKGNGALLGIRLMEDVKEEEEGKDLSLPSDAARHCRADEGEDQLVFIYIYLLLDVHKKKWRNR